MNCEKHSSLTEQLAPYPAALMRANMCGLSVEVWRWRIEYEK